MIRTESLVKHYRSAVAVDGLSLSVPEGSVYGLLGPNAAGKTTTLKLLLGIAQPTSGSGQVLGHDIVRDSLAVRREASYVADDKSLYRGMRVRDFLRYYLSFFPAAELTDAMAYLERWQIDAAQRTERLSRGTRLKVLLAAVFARRARVTLLDEPTEGLDPAAIEDVLGELVARSAELGTVLLATHRLEEVERVCDRVGIIQRGRLVLEGELDELRVGWKRIVLHSGAETTSSWPDIVCDEEVLGARVLTTRRFGPRHRELLAGLGGRAVEVQEMNLREIYLTVTGRGSNGSRTLEAAVS